MKGIFQIMYKFTPQGETYSLVFFIDGDNIFKTKINTRVFNQLLEGEDDDKNNDKLQAYLRKRYDYHNDSVKKIDDVEIKGLYDHFTSIDDKDNRNKVWAVMRNRKIDDIFS